MNALINPESVAAAVFGTNDRAHSPALIDPANDPIDYATLLIAVQSLATSLREVGLSAQDRIAILSPKGSAGLVAFLAASSCACCCPLNPGMRGDEFEACFQTLGITALLDGTEGSAAAKVAARVGIPTVTFAWRKGTVSATASAGDRRRTGSASTIIPPGTALLMQTSGTTSNPKLVALTHANILSAARGITATFSLDREDVCLNPMPLHHMHGLVTAALSSLLAGSSVYVMEGFTPSAFHEASVRLQPTWFTGSPTMHLALREFYSRGSATMPCTRLRFFRSSSAPLPLSVIAELETIFGAPLTETYGLTETSSMICANPLPPGGRKPGSVGIAIGAEIKVVDEKGDPRPDGESGEIVVRGPSVINRYLGVADSSGLFFGDWLRTGDIGFLDSDGYLFVVGRVKELIKRGGLSVYPDEVDNVLVSHEGIAESVTFSVPHPSLGEELVSAVVAKAGQNPSEKELKDFVSRQLSSYKVPAAIITVPSLPKKETGKVVRREIPVHFASRLAPTKTPPADPFETVLLGLWQDFLERTDFGVEDNLLLLGADPLRAARVSELVATRLGKKLSAKDIMAEPTVRAMASQLR